MRVVREWVIGMSKFDALLVAIVLFVLWFVPNLLPTSITYGKPSPCAGNPNIYFDESGVARCLKP